MKILKIYTDGAFKNNKGTYGFVIIEDNKVVHEKYDKIEGMKNLTNNIAELYAIIKSLDWVFGTGYSPKEYCIYVYTDSQYVQLGLNKYIYTWIKNQWKSSSGKLVKNINLWKKLFKLSSRYFIYVQWINSHNGDIYNERVDKGCRKLLEENEK